MAEDIDFKYPMKKACAYEIATFCKDVPHGHARVIRCLETKIDEEDMSKECKDEGETSITCLFSALLSVGAFRLACVCGLV